MAEVIDVLGATDPEAIEKCAIGLSSVRVRRRQIVHTWSWRLRRARFTAVNDFRKICGFEAYLPTDNVSELTARTNDEGWDTTFSEWLRGSRLEKRDGVLVFSVGGGDAESGVSVNLVRALELSKEVGASVFGIVGRDGGFTSQIADACVVFSSLP